MADATRTRRKIISGSSDLRRVGIRTKPPRGVHFTHFDSAGQAHMVDVAAKDATKRIARAGGRIVMRADTLALIRHGEAKKGDVLAVARIAAIQAAKRAADLIPLAHPLPLTRVAVTFTLPIGTENTSATICATLIISPWPISVPPWFTWIEPSA